MRLILIVLLLTSACAPYKKRAEECLGRPISEREKTALAHPLYSFIPRCSSQIYPFDIGHWTTWALFGDDDSGLFGESLTCGWHTDEPISLRLAAAWHMRNPWHNLFFYVIGQAYMKNSEITFVGLSQEHSEAFTYREKGKTFSKNSHFYLGLHGWKPFFQLRLNYTEKYQSDFYLGWRERGNFGLKFIPITTYN
jgi:hypothetical protein